MDTCDSKSHTTLVRLETSGKILITLYWAPQSNRYRKQGLRNCGRMATLASPLRRSRPSLVMSCMRWPRHLLNVTIRDRDLRSNVELISFTCQSRFIGFVGTCVLVHSYAYATVLVAPVRCFVYVTFVLSAYWETDYWENKRDVCMCVELGRISLKLLLFGP